MISLIASSCSVRRFLPKGERLYKGATVKVVKGKDVKASTGSLRREIKKVARPKSNTIILGQPYKVWWWYVI
ncbi:MAG: hypothetical protein HY305_00595, partial [Sphingobacteriales bacterium]|nr:hypothetical protein [Sphingobacteriales bacterium]